MRRLPAPLAMLLCVGLLQALAWSVVLPAWQGQDERSHFAYAQRIAETGNISWRTLDDPPTDRGSFSTEVFESDRYTGAGPLDLNVAARPFAAPVDELRWDERKRTITDAQRGDGGDTSAMRNPPLWPLYEVLVYLPLQDVDVVSRAFAMRLAAIPFLLLTIAAAWLLAGEVFGRRRWLQTVTAGAVALHPFLAQLGGVNNPDVAIAAAYGIGLWLSAVIVNRGVTRGRVAGAVLVSLAGAGLHPRALPVAVPLIVAMLVRAWPHIVARGRGARRAAIGAILAALALLGVASLYIATARDVTVTSTREFLSYLWQFYLPRPGFMTPTRVPEYDARDVFVDRLFSGYAPLDVEIAPWILDLIAVLWPVGVIALVAALVAQREAARRRAAIGLVLVSAVLGMMLSLHTAAWQALQDSTDPVITGRYLTPLLPLAGLAVAVIALALPRRIGPGAATAVLGAQGLIGLSAFGAAVLRFHV